MKILNLYQRTAGYYAAGTNIETISCFKKQVNSLPLRGHKSASDVNGECSAGIFVR